MVKYGYETINHSYEIINHSYETIKHSYEIINHSYETINHRYETISHSYKHFQWKVLSFIIIQISIFTTFDGNLVTKIKEHCDVSLH